MRTKITKITLLLIVYIFSTNIDLLGQTSFEYDVAGNQIATSYQGSNACIDPTTSSEEIIDENLALYKIAAYPNPFSQNLMIELEVNKAGIINVALLNALGEIITHPITNEYFIEGDHTIILPLIKFKGVLIVQLTSAYEIFTKKVISQ